MIRFLLIELPDARWRLVIVAHHIVIDGWSLPLFVGELIALYRSGGDTAALPAATTRRTATTSAGSPAATRTAAAGCGASI